MSERCGLRPLAIDWESLENAFLARSSTWEHHDLLDTETGEVLYIHNAVLRSVQDGDTGVRYLAEWQKEQIPVAEQVLSDSSGRYVPIPMPESGEVYRAMRDFAVHQMGEIGQELLEALDGRGAWRRFRHTLNEYPRVRKHWNRYDSEWRRQWLLDWLRSLGIQPAPVGRDETARHGVSMRHGR